jgi:uncharacterized protein (TIGR02246 family)
MLNADNKGGKMSSPAGYLDFRNAVENTARKFEKAASVKDAAAIAAVYAEDAILLPQGLPQIKGRQNIQQFWQNLFDAGAANASIRAVDVSPIGDAAYEVGTWEADMPVPGSGTARTVGKYVVIWKRQPDGEIRIVVDIFNSNA